MLCKIINMPLVFIFYTNNFRLFYRTDFLVTASCDGHVKFWKKTEEGIEFVKHFRSHLGTVQYCIRLQKV